MRSLVTLAFVSTSPDTLRRSHVLLRCIEGMSVVRGLVFLKEEAVPEMQLCESAHNVMVKSFRLPTTIPLINRLFTVPASTSHNMHYRNSVQSS
jgi:hypothetical protein